MHGNTGATMNAPSLSTMPNAPGLQPPTTVTAGYTPGSFTTTMVPVSNNAVPMQTTEQQQQQQFAYMQQSAQGYNTGVHPMTMLPSSQHNYQQQQHYSQQQTQMPTTLFRPMPGGMVMSGFMMPQGTQSMANLSSSSLMIPTSSMPGTDLAQTRKSGGLQVGERQVVGNLPVTGTAANNTMKPTDVNTPSTVPGKAPVAPPATSPPPEATTRTPARNTLPQRRWRPRVSLRDEKFSRWLPESPLFAGLQDQERRIESMLAKKRTEVQEALSAVKRGMTDQHMAPGSVRKRLRLYISDTGLQPDDGVQEGRIQKPQDGVTFAEQSVDVSEKEMRPSADKVAPVDRDEQLEARGRSTIDADAVRDGEQGGDWKTSLVSRSDEGGPWCITISGRLVDADDPFSHPGGGGGDPPQDGGKERLPKLFHFTHYIRKAIIKIKFDDGKSKSVTWSRHRHDRGARDSFQIRGVGSRPVVVDIVLQIDRSPELWIIPKALERLLGLESGPLGGLYSQVYVTQHIWSYLKRRNLLQDAETCSAVVDAPLAAALGLDSKVDATAEERDLEKCKVHQEGEDNIGDRAGSEIGADSVAAQDDGDGIGSAKEKTDKEAVKTFLELQQLLKSVLTPAPPVTITRKVKLRPKENSDVGGVVEEADAPMDDHTESLDRRGDGQSNDAVTPKKRGSLEEAKDPFCMQGQPSQKPSDTCTDVEGPGSRLLQLHEKSEDDPSAQERSSSETKNVHVSVADGWLGETQCIDLHFELPILVNGASPEEILGAREAHMQKLAEVRSRIVQACRPVCSFVSLFAYVRMCVRGHV